MKLGNQILGALFVSLALSNTSVSAVDISGEAQVVSAASRNKDEQRSLIETHVYLEAGITEDISGFIVGYHDQEFRSAVVGLASKVGNLQIGLGIGQATYDQSKHFLLNPLAYYSDDTYTAYLHVEHYGNEGDNPWFVRGYALRKFGVFSVGAYGDSDFGLGPRIDARIGEHFSAWAALPVVLRPREGGMQSMVGVVVGF